MVLRGSEYSKNGGSTVVMVIATSSKFLRSFWYKFYRCQRTLTGWKCVDCRRLWTTGNGLEPPDFTLNGSNGGPVVMGGASLCLHHWDGGGVGLFGFRGESQTSREDVQLMLLPVGSGTHFAA